MGQAIGQSLVIAVGIAISPLAMIAIVLMLTTQRARSNGPAFIVGWLIGLGVVGTVVLAITGPSNAGQSEPPSWDSWIKIVLGLLLFLVAAREYRGRPKPGEEPALPKWMGRVDTTKPLGSLGLAAVLAGLNPKNLVLAVGGAATIAQTGIPGGQQALAYTAFALVATVGVAIPVIIYFALGDRASVVLGELKDWLSRNNTVIMAVLCLVIGVKLIGDGVSALTS